MWPVKWTKINSKHGQNHNFKIENSLLKFDHLSEKDFGDYSCTSFNLFGLAEINLVINRDTINVSKQNYKPSLKRRVNKIQRTKKIKRKQGSPVGIELRKRRFKKRFELIKHLK